MTHFLSFVKRFYSTRPRNPFFLRDFLVWQAAEQSVLFVSGKEMGL
jgi:hypothetical protein